MGLDDVPCWLHGLALFPIHFMPLSPKTRKPMGPFANFDWARGEHGASQALQWLSDGKGVAVVLNPPLFVIDCDSVAMAKWVEGLLKADGIKPLMVRTRRGIHFYGLLPTDFPIVRLKAHLHCHLEHPDWGTLEGDFKFGPNSYVVGPGTVRHDAGIVYTPLSEWPAVLPVVDPRLILPTGEFWHLPKGKIRQRLTHPAEAALGRGYGPAEAEASRDTRPFVMYTRSHAHAIQAGSAFLRSPKTQVSVAGRGGRRQLAYVAEHLVGWLGLKPKDAVALLTDGKDSWNARCRYTNGDPYPWARGELLSAMKQAVGQGSECGRRECARMAADQAARAELQHFVSILKKSLVVVPGPRLPVARVLRLFRWMGLPDLTNTALGVELRKQNIQVVKATRKKIVHIPGLAYPNLVESILNSKGDSLGGCPLLASSHTPKRSTNSLHMPDALYGSGCGDGFPERTSAQMGTVAEFSSDRSSGAGYQMAFPWAEVSTGPVLAPTSPCLAKLRVLVSQGLLGVMASRPPAELRDRACRLFWPHHRVPKTDLRMLRMECRKAGLVDGDGALTRAGLLALGLDGAA